MSESNHIAVARFTNGGRTVIVPKLWQHDWGQILQIEGLDLPPTFEVHFSNHEKTGYSKPQIYADGSVTIPDEYVTSGEPVYAFIVLHDTETDGETRYRIKMPVVNRPEPTETEPTPVQQDVITEAIAALNSAVTQTSEYASAAHTSEVNASNSAEDAQTAATNAAQSTTEAGQSATSAGQSATSASQSAASASQSAGAASRSANTARIQAQSAQASAQAAQASAQSIQNMNVEAETLAPGSQATAEWSDGTLSLGIPRGDKGLKGDPGNPGDPGFSPSASVSKSGTTTTVTVTDEHGTTTATILDGAKGDPGDPGTSPTASVSKSGNKSTITITDDEGTTTAEVLDGSPGIPGVSPTVTVTDITGGHRITITDAEHPGGISFDVMDGSDADAPVQDVLINGSSIVDANGDANISLLNSGGIAKNSINELYLDIATNTNIKAGGGYYKPITGNSQHQAAFYGLARASGDSTQSASSNTVGNYTDDAKSKISEMLSGAISVTGTTPTINALPGLRYICGECSTLTVNLPASGCVDVQFESGSTPTVLTVNPASGQTLKWANGFDPTSLDANTTYEINIADGLGVAGSWT